MLFDMVGELADRFELLPLWFWRYWKGNPMGNSRDIMFETCRSFCTMDHGWCWFQDAPGMVSRCMNLQMGTVLPAAGCIIAHSTVLLFGTPNIWFSEKFQEVWAIDWEILTVSWIRSAMVILVILVVSEYVSCHSQLWYPPSWEWTKALK